MNRVNVKSNVSLIPLEEGLVASIAAQKANNLSVYEQALSLVWNQDKSIENNYTILEAYSQIYQRVVSSRLKMIEDVDLIRRFYLVDVALEQITEDALSPEIGTDEILEIKYPKDPKIEKELQRLERKLNLDQFLVNIVPDLCAYGEYVVKTEVDGGGAEQEVEDSLGNRTTQKTKAKGLTALRDIVEQGTIISLTQDSEQMGYLGMDELGRIVRYENADFVKFTLGGQRIRVRLEDQVPFAKNEKVRAFLDKLPRFVRVGKSMIHKLIPKFKELELLEKLVPASKLSKLSNVNLVGMNVPGQMDLQKALEATKKLEGIINNKVSIDNKLGELTVESVLSVAGRTKILPIFGDKGNLSKLDYKIDEADDLASSAEDIRRVIMDSIGIPYELIFKSDDGSKAETLKRYARYLRRLKNVQRALAEGVKDICCIHLANKDIEFNSDDIMVEFKNRLVEIDNLDKLEHADVTISFLGNIHDFVVEKMMSAESPLKSLVNVDALAEYINRNLKTIGLGDLLRTQDEGGISAQVQRALDQVAKDKAGNADTGADADSDTSTDSAPEDDDLADPDMAT